jgi:hypothetical protein
MVWLMRVSASVVLGTDDRCPPDPVNFRCRHERRLRGNCRPYAIETAPAARRHFPPLVRALTANTQDKSLDTLF